MGSMTSFGPNSFNFKDLSMKKSHSDYFNMRPVQGSSPTASLAADLSQNFRIDQRWVAERVLADKEESMTLTKKQSAVGHATTFFVLCMSIWGREWIRYAPPSSRNRTDVGCLLMPIKTSP